MTAINEQPEATLTTKIQVGRLVAGQVERALRAAAHGWIDLHIDRQMGLLGGWLLVTATGPSDAIRRFQRDLEDWQPWGDSGSSEAVSTHG